MGTLNIFDFLIVISGIYLIYSAVVMKVTGKIAGGAIVSKDVDINKIRDKEGFIKYMFGKTLFVGIFTCALGFVGILTTRFNGPAYLALVGLVGCLIVLILFAKASSKARKLYIDDIK